MLVKLCMAWGSGTDSIWLSWPGRPDLTFVSAKAVVFVNGCFWHAHGCKRSQLPKSNTDYWCAKLDRNKRRDRRNTEQLEDEGWTVFVVWECEIDAGIEAVASYLRTNR